MEANVPSLVCTGTVVVTVTVMVTVIVMVVYGRWVICAGMNVVLKEAAKAVSI